MGTIFVLVLSNSLLALAVSGPVFDGLYEFYRRQLLTGREPA